MSRVRSHAGEILREEYLTPLEMSARQLAEAIAVPADGISDIVRERCGVSADTALRLEQVPPDMNHLQHVPACTPGNHPDSCFPGISGAPSAVEISGILTG